MQSLEDIQIFTKLIDEIQTNANLNEVDLNYQKLQLTITPLEKETVISRRILKYVENTHADSHNGYTLRVDKIYEIQSKTEEARYRQELGNKHLLWHGSRLTNYVGILSQGLRIAPA